MVSVCRNAQSFCSYSYTLFAESEYAWTLELEAYCTGAYWNGHSIVAHLIDAHLYLQNMLGNDSLCLRHIKSHDDEEHPNWQLGDFFDLRVTLSIGHR